MKQEYLKSILTYCKASGVFKWRVKHSKKVNAGAIAGGRNVAGYTVIGIDRKVYYAHRLAWLYVNGEWPIQIDHRNCDKADNRWRNLRLANHTQNALNAKLTIRNTSGRKGVSWQKSANKWAASIYLDGRKIHLGLFDNIEAAHSSYMAAAKRAEPKFARAS